MPTGGQLGTGVRVGYSLSSPHSWVRVTQVLEAEPPRFERDRVETTTHGDTSIRRYTPGLADVSDATALLLADLDRATSPSHMGLKDLERAQTLVWIRYEVPIENDLDTTDYLVYEFQGRVGNWGLQTPIDGRKEIEVSFQFGGEDITLYEGVASAF